MRQVDYFNDVAEILQSKDSDLTKACKIGSLLEKAYTDGEASGKLTLGECYPVNTRGNPYADNVTYCATKKDIPVPESTEPTYTTTSIRAPRGTQGSR